MSASQRSACFSVAPSLLDVFVLDVLCKQGTRRDRRLPGHDSPQLCWAWGQGMVHGTGSVCHPPPHLIASTHCPSPCRARNLC